MSSRRDAVPAAVVVMAAVALAVVLGGCAFGEKVKVSASDAGTIQVVPGGLLPRVAPDGQTFWCCTLTVKNASDVKPHDMSTSEVKLLMADGQTYDRTKIKVGDDLDAIEVNGFTFSRADMLRFEFPDRTLQPGDSAEGMVVFCIPANVQPGQLVYQPQDGKPVEIKAPVSGS